MKKIICFIFLMLSFTVSTAYASNCAEAKLSEQRRNHILEELTAPVNAQNMDQNVSTFSGELNLDVTELTLPGKNGHDVVIKRQHRTNFADEILASAVDIYMTSEATIRYNNVAYIYESADGYAYKIVFASEQEMLEKAPESFYARSNFQAWDTDDADEPGYYKYDEINVSHGTAGAVLLTRDKTLGLTVARLSKRDCIVTSKESNNLFNPRYQDYDWEYNIPMFCRNIVDDTDIHDEDSNYYDPSRERWKNGFLRDYEGNIIELCWGTKKGSDGEWYPHTFKAKHNTGKGYKLEFLSVTDITQNGLSYNRTVTDNKGRIHYINASNELIACDDKYGNRISYRDGEIVDSTGKIIYVDKTGITVRGENYTVPAVRYVKESINNNRIDPHNKLSLDDTYLMKVYSGDIHLATYHYKKRNLLFYYDYTSSNITELKNSAAYASATEVFNLIEIEYPNGEAKCFEYEEAARYSGKIASQTKYRVSAVYDIINENYYQYYCNSYQYEYSNPSEGKQNGASCSTTVTRSGGRQHYTDYYENNSEARITSRNYRNYGVDKTITYEYEAVDSSRYFLKDKIVTEGGYYTTTSHTEYDSSYNLIEESDGVYTATYTYDPTYNVMLTKTYNKDADTVIRVENTLTEDKKDVATSKVYENNILVNQTDYEYPVYEDYYSINTSVWKEDINENGIKDVNESALIENRYDHDSEYFIPYSFDHFTFTYDMVDADGVNLDYHYFVTEYDTFGNIYGIDDGNANLTMIERDFAHRPVYLYNPNSAFQTIEYNDAENSTIHTNENGEQTKTFYNLYGQITAQYRMMNNEWVLCLENFYNHIGLIEQEIVYRSADMEDKIVTDYRYGMGDRLTNITVYDKDNNIIRQETKSYQFTPNYYIVSTQVTGDDSITPATKKEYYDTVGNLVKEELVNGTKILTTTYTYDKVNNVLTVTDPNGNTTTNTYDYANRLLTQTDPQGGIVTNVYDKGGRLIATTDAMGNQSTFRYDNLDRMIEKNVPLNDSETAKHKYYYDMSFNLILEKVLTQSENGMESYQETSYAYNENNQLTDTTVGGLLHTAYEYDPVGRTTKMLVGMENPQITEYSYNELGQLTAVTAPNGTSEAYQHDLLGNVVSKTDRNGIVTATVYNGQNLPVSVTATKDGSSETMAYSYNVLGSPVSVTNETGTISYTYDNFGRLTLETFPQNVTNAYTYDNNGNRLSYTMKTGNTQRINTAYTYNNLNQLTQVDNGDIITTYSYDANGNLLTETTGDNISTFTYDNANRMTGLVNAYGNTPRETETYTYYLDGNKKSVTDMTGKVTQYTYDNAGRLIAETVDSSATSYTYDGYNNRIGKNKNGVQTSYIYDNRNRLTKETTSENGQTAVTSYQYDPNGNLYSRQTLTFAEDNTQEPKVSAVLMGYTAETNDMLLEYNNFNQLTATTGDEMVSYDYYANGMRQSKTVDGYTTTHIWDGQNMVGEITEDNFTGYLRGARLIARQMGANTQYYHFNGHGDTSSITDGNGTALRNYTYDAFGNVEHLHDLDTNPFRYCGEYYDAETGFIYLRNRYYDPSMGRFISEDPIRDGLNWYVYCGNNPVMFVDPLGLWMDGDEQYSEIKQIMLHQLGSTWDLATTQEAKDAIHQAANDLRGFDDNSFDRMIYLNDEDGAEGMGHAGVLLLNAEYESLLFSFYPTSEEIPDIISVSAEMRFDVLSASETKNLLYGTGQIASAVASDGVIVTSENYNRFVYYDISVESGINMYSTGVHLYGKPGTYHILGRQCDNIVDEIMTSGGYGYDIGWRPNATYENLSKTYHSWRLN